MTAFGQAPGEFGWEEVTTAPPLRAGAVHVWQDSLDESVSRPWATDELSSAETALAARWKNPARRHAFVRGRLLVRHLLGQYFERTVDAFTVDVYENGKPYVRSAADVPAIEISIAHSGIVLLVAISRAGDVGVDVERVNPTVDREAIARKFFAADETEALAACTPDAGERAFFRCWTRKEAVIKALGTGLSTSLSSFVVSIEDVAVSPVLGAATTDDAGLPWMLHDVTPGGEYVGSLAVRGTDVPVRRFLLTS